MIILSPYPVLVYLSTSLPVLWYQRGLRGVVSINQPSVYHDKLINTWKKSRALALLHSQGGDVGNTSNAVLLACWLEALPFMQRSGDVMCRPGRRTTTPYQMVDGEMVGTKLELDTRAKLKATDSAGKERGLVLSGSLPLSCIYTHVGFSTTFLRFLENMMEKTKLPNAHHLWKLLFRSWPAHPFCSAEPVWKHPGTLRAFPFESRLR